MRYSAYFLQRSAALYKLCIFWRIDLFSEFRSSDSYKKAGVSFVPH